MSYNNRKDKSQARKTNTRGRQSSEADKDKETSPSRQPGKRPTKKYNDVAWYFGAGQVAKDVTSLSFNNALGGDLNFLQEDAGSTDPGFSYGSIPGICVIHTIPSVGWATSKVSGINVAANNLYAWVRHANSGSANGDAPDMMMGVLAMDQIYSAIAWLIRIYGTARVYSQTNRYIGDALITAMGVDPSDIRKNIADFRAMINAAVVKAGVINVPNIMPIFKRHIFMYSNVYRDEDIDKSSMFLYNPVGFWKYSETGSTNLAFEPAGCEFSTTDGFITRTSLLKFAQLEYLINDMLDAIIKSEDFNIMSGDMLKAFKRENLFGLAQIPEDFISVPVYSEEICEQIHNTTFVGNVPTDLEGNVSLSSLNLIQGTGINQGTILFQPKFKTARGLSYSKLLDFYKQEVTPEDVMVATRNSVMSSGYFGPDYITSSIDCCGVDIATFCTVYKLNAGSLVGSDYCKDSWAATSAGSLTTIDKFNWFPVLTLRSGTTQTRPNLLVGDVGNYYMLHKSDLIRMHDVALLSLFGVNALGNIGEVLSR